MLNLALFVGFGAAWIALGGALLYYFDKKD